MTVLLFIFGLVLLVLGAELLVRGASKVAAAFGISPLIIGLTVVAYGTSAPELAVSVQSSLAGQADLALGNVVGSNIANVLLILGISASVAPLIVSRQLVRLDVPLMIGLSILLFLLAFDGRIGRLDGAFFVLCAVGYSVFKLIQSRRESQTLDEQQVSSSPTKGVSQWLIQIGFIIGGLALLVLGANWLVNSAVTFATALGVNELIIGLTIVAIGTSLPELATSVVASVRGERDIAVGNVIGSNIFNIVTVLGVASVVAPDGIQVPGAALAFDLPVMLAVAVACLPVFFTGYQIARWEGLLFLGYYVAYTLYLILQATQHAALPLLGNVMLMFVVPLTVITLTIVVIRAIRERRVRMILRTDDLYPNPATTDTLDDLG
ncbi:MAG: calcium/sodium antiporter [Chloroflexi bacterium AL-W]|nr:calcium/sodium antiporter [Chloroflexi bacterium AL-N10]NOK78523.1 calcium/sodium antiporter [Chloroflexi bacterium AL-N5]NOK85607.1 calcium/sodium antiporter [Chloroflexi bacterium AL-W]NOK92521.1 calcium/sodium antiporter [Chloroflexi bacterium AL-N15]